MNFRPLTVGAVLLLSACGQTGPLYRPGAEPPPPQPMVLETSSGHTEPAAITVPPPKPDIADPQAATAAPDSSAPVEHKEDVNVVPPMDDEDGSTANKK